MPISDYQCHGQNPKQFDHAGSFHCHFLSDKLNIATYWLPKPELLRIFFYFPLPDTMPKMHNKGCYSPDKPKIEGWYSEILLLGFAHCYLFFSNAVTTVRHQILVWGVILQHDCQAQFYNKRPTIHNRDTKLYHSTIFSRFGSPGSSLNTVVQVTQKK